MLYGADNLETLSDNDTRNTTDEGGLNFCAALTRGAGEIVYNSGVL